jgi:hypothetical protein
MEYVPTGILSSSELKNKMSLYLLGQLYYGITLVHQVQVKTFYGINFHYFSHSSQFHGLDDTMEVNKSLWRVSKIDGERRKSRKRSAVTDGEEDGVELVGGEDKKKRPSRPSKGPPLLDLTSIVCFYQPSTYKL